MYIYYCKVRWFDCDYRDEKEGFHLVVGKNFAEAISYLEDYYEDGIMNITVNLLDGEVENIADISNTLYNEINSFNFME